MTVSSTPNPYIIYNNIPAVKHPARPTMAQPAVREMVDEARELIGNDVDTEPAAELAVGSVATVAGAAAESEPVPDEGAAEGAATAPLASGTRFAVAFLQFALYPSRVFAAVGLMAKTMPA